MECSTHARTFPVHKVHRTNNLLTVAVCRPISARANARSRVEHCRRALVGRLLFIDFGGSSDVFSQLFFYRLGLNMTPAIDI